MTKYWWNLTQVVTVKLGFLLRLWTSLVPMGGQQYLKMFNTTSICEQVDANKADSTSKDSKEANILYFDSDRARSSASDKTLCNATSFWYHAVCTPVHAKLVKHQELLLNEQHGTFPSWLTVCRQSVLDSPLIRSKRSFLPILEEVWVYCRLLRTC